MLIVLLRELGSLAIAFLLYAILWNLCLGNRTFLWIHRSIGGGLECDKFKCLSFGIFVLKSSAICAIFCSQQLEQSPVILLYVLFLFSVVRMFFSVGCSF